MWRCLSRFQQEYPGPFLLRIIGRGWGPSIIPPELQERVYLEPYIESANLPHFYSSLDYYLCTSRVEGVPYPVLEAMSCESVVLSTEVGIVPEIMIDGKNGFLLREGSIERDFLAAMHQTSHDQHLRDRYGRAARATVVQQRSWEVAVSLQEYEEVYTTARQRYALRSPLERFTLHLQSRFALLVHPIQQAVTGGISFVRSKIRLRSRLRNVKLP
jgi:glycosyltransferase involved in cell wall biosynthesis